MAASGVVQLDVVDVGHVVGVEPGVEAECDLRVRADHGRPVAGDVSERVMVADMADELSVPDPGDLEVRVKLDLPAVHGRVPVFRTVMSLVEPSGHWARITCSTVPVSYSAARPAGVAATSAGVSTTAVASAAADNRVRPAAAFDDVAAARGGFGHVATADQIVAQVAEDTVKISAAADGIVPVVAVQYVGAALADIQSFPPRR